MASSRPIFTLDEELPGETVICAITMAELTAGPHLATASDEGARRQARLQRVEATFEALDADFQVYRFRGRQRFETVPTP